MTTEEEDVRRTVSGLESWISALSIGLLPLFRWLFHKLRRLVLAALGGVPADQATAKPSANELQAQATVGEQRQRPEPRWSHRDVVDCLRRIADGRRPLQSVLGRLPADVRDWLSVVSVDDASDLRSLPRGDLRQRFEEWVAAGKDWGLAKAAFAPRPASSKLSRDDGEHDPDHTADEALRGPRR